MQQEQFLNILEKYRNGTASKAETDLILAYYHAFEFRPDLLTNMSVDDQEMLELEMKNRIDERLAEEEELPVALLARKPPVWLACAASVLLLLVSTFFFWDRKEGSVQKTASAKLDRKVNKLNNFIQLPDGSTVILTAGSTIDYPRSFQNQKVREVHLSGEGYFDIRHLEGKPFIVRTGKLTTTVLGTAFHIKALSGDKSIIVTVTRGRVRLHDQNRTIGDLIPDQQITYNNETQSFIQEMVDADQSALWKTKDLLFEDVTVYNACRLIEDRYKVTIQVEGEKLKEQRFTTTFGKEETLESILISITAFNDAKYELDPKTNTVTISPN